MYTPTCTHAYTHTYAQVWEGRGVVATGRKIIGATNPAASEPGTIRGDFAIEIGRNIIHGSDATESAAKEIALWCVFCVLVGGPQLLNFEGGCSEKLLHPLIPSNRDDSTVVHRISVHPHMGSLSPSLSLSLSLSISLSLCLSLSLSLSLSPYLSLPLSLFIKPRGQKETQ